MISDKTIAVSYIMIQWGTQSVSMFQLTQELFLWCDKHKVSIRVSHIPGKLNIVADMLSRKGQMLPTQWILNPEIFKQIQSRFPTIKVDLFANCLNHQLPIYVSPFSDDQAWGLDALSFQWETLMAYAYLPTSLISQILTKIRLYNHSNRSMLAKPTMVPNTIRTTCRLPDLAAHTQKDVEATTVSDLSLKTRKPSPTHVAFITKDLVERGISQEVAEQAARPPSLCLYQFNFKTFSDW